MNKETPLVAIRAALYLRVSTTGRAEHDVSIPDQKRQGEAYCLARGYQLIDTFVEPGASATNDRRPEFQRMIEAGTSKPAPVRYRRRTLVQPLLSRSLRAGILRPQAGQERRQARLDHPGDGRRSDARHDAPDHGAVRRVSVEGERQSTSCAPEGERPAGFWNGALPPIGYRIVAAEQRGAKTKKKLEIDPLHADTVRLIYRWRWRGTARPADGRQSDRQPPECAPHLHPRRRGAGALASFTAS